MFVTKKRLLEEVRKAKLEGIADGKQDLERQVEMAKLRGEKEGYNMGHSDRTNFYTMSVLPELEGKIKGLEVFKEVAEKRHNEMINLYEKINNLEKELKESEETIANYEVANKSLREIGERLMFRVGELKEELEIIPKIQKEKGRLYWSGIYLKGENNILKGQVEELKMNNDLYDFQEIKRLEQLMKKVKRVKVKKKIQSRIDKLMIRGLK